MKYSGSMIQRIHKYLLVLENHILILTDLIHTWVCGKSHATCLLWWCNVWHTVFDGWINKYLNKYIFTISILVFQDIILFDEPVRINNYLHTKILFYVLKITCDLCVFSDWNKHPQPSIRIIRNSSRKSRNRGPPAQACVFRTSQCNNSSVHNCGKEWQSRHSTWRWRFDIRPGQVVQNVLGL